MTDTPFACAHAVRDIAALRALYGPVNPNSIAKETPDVTSTYRQWLEKSNFFAIASIGPEGLDCSPRGDAPGGAFEIVDAHTLLIPDRRGNNRIDTLANIVRDPRVALLFFIPGVPETLRINGRAEVTTEPELLSRFAVAGKPPKTVIRVRVDDVYFQCARALTRARLWDPDARLAPGAAPSAGEMTKAALPAFDAEAYDAELRARQARTLY